MDYKSFIREHTGLIIISVVFFCIGLLRLNDLSLLNPDSSRYLIWGNSIAHGSGFVDNTQPEPEYFVIQAPLYPIIIAPVELFFPFSQTAVKIWTLLWGVAVVVLFYFLVNRHFGKVAALVGTIVLTCNPLLIIYSTEVLSDAPFLALILLVFLLTEKYLLTSGQITFRICMLMISVVAVAMLREVGISLVLAALIFYFYIKQWKIATLITISTFIFVGVWYLRNNILIGELPPQMQGGNMNLITQHFLTPPDAPLVNEIALRLWEKSNEYFAQFSGMLIYPLFMSQQFRLNVDPSGFHQSLTVAMKSFGKVIILALTIPMILFGIYLDIQKSKTSVLRLLFGLFYLCLVLLYPAHDIRFLLPLLPLLIFYCLHSIKWFYEKLKISEKYGSQKFVAALFLFLMIPNLSGIYEVLKINLAYRESPIKFYERVRRLPSYPLMFTQPWSLMGKWICENLPDTVVLASPSKELSTVVGNRKVLEIDQSSVLPTFEMLLRDNHVDYILTTIRRENFNLFEFFMMESKRFAFEPAHSTANLHLMKVRSRLREYIQPDTSEVYAGDTVSATYLLRRGRVELMNEHYTTAAEMFKKALSIDSTLPEIYYQAIVAYAMMGDSINATNYYDKLFTLPQALGYVGNARMQIQAMRMLFKARHESFQPSRAVGSYNVASLYWKIGYYERAASIMVPELGIDSSYFVGLLWGLHFNLQNGDTTKAKQYLSILGNLDSSNPVVKSFSKILEIGDLLQCAQSSVEKSRLHLEMGKLYKQIELNEVAIDEAERALRDDPNNFEAYLLMAQLFERKSNLRMADRMYRQVLFRDPQNAYVIAKLDSVGRILLKR
jgi:tetratricopeptide (TPR) repeat protein/4-amino-4-deoxy-L-arabinose transferase-like glycosyltransferase